jgi:hypothetical protein
MLNPNLNPVQLRAAYAQHRSLSIQNILVPAVAESIHKALTALDWNLEINDYTPSPRFRIPLTPELTDVPPCVLLDSLEHGMDAKQLFYLRLCVEAQHFLHPDLVAFREYVNTPEFLGALREITGEPDVTHTWIEATCYDKGCFLGGHRDDHHPQNVVAIVFNFTPHWQIDWGGLLTLVYPQRQPVLVPPAWNSLSLFTIPLDHLVSAVSPAATAKRYSLTGWLRRGPLTR